MSKKTKLHDTLPIYLEELATLPKHMVYRLVDPRNNKPFYIGETTKETYVSRYRKHINATGYHAHEGDRKMQQIKDIRSAGKLPLMIIFDGATTSANAKELERQYKDYYFNRGHEIVNHSSMKPLAKTHVKRVMSRIIDSLF